MPVSESENSIKTQYVFKMNSVKTKDMIKDKEFLNKMAHEFKNPLTKIYSAAQLLQDMVSEEEKGELIDFILNGSKKLVYLMNNFFEYSKDKELSNDGLSKMQEDLVPIIDKVIRDLEFFINSRNHELILNLPDSLVVNIDSFKIEQVITNLLNNAIKFTPPNGTIEIKLEQDGKNIIFSIKDNGIGIKKNDLKKLFRKFSVIKSYPELNEDMFMEGTGLGLYLSKRIIESHNGEIWAESEGVNQGTSFFFKLPRGDQFK